MINPAMRGLVKIGLTKRTSNERAKELRGTGVPEDFLVIYDELVTDCKLVENRLHERFNDYRHQPDREFFRIPIKDAVRGLMEESVNFLIPHIGVNSGIEILPNLKNKYPNHLKPDLHSIKIIHTDGIVYLESARYPHPNLRNQIIERTDLGFISEESEKMFSTSRSPEENARLFVHQLDEYSMIHCTDLFTDAACDEINERHKRS